MLNKWEGIVLRAIPYGETNEIVTLFTKEVGKATVMARGSKKQVSRLSAVTQPFAHAAYLVYASRKGMGTLQQGDLIESMRSIQSDLKTMAYASYIAELVDRSTEPYDSRTKGVYHLLVQAFSALEEGYDPAVITLFVEWQLLPVNGTYPVVHECASCGATEGQFAYSFKEIGLLCHRCFHVDARAVPLPPAIVRLIRMFQTVPIDQIGNVSLKPETIRFIQRIVRTIYDEETGLYFKSRRFLEQMERTPELAPLPKREQKKP